ncbi:hypothetical protein [Helicobacter sp. 23-1045]
MPNSPLDSTNEMRDFALDFANRPTASSLRDLPKANRGNPHFFAILARVKRAKNLNYFFRYFAIAQSVGLDKETSALPCFANEVKQPYDKEFAESNIKNTHPLAPSAREGEQNIDSANRPKFAESNIKSPPPFAINTPPQTPPARGGAFSISPSLADGKSKFSPSQMRAGDKGGGLIPNPTLDSANRQSTSSLRGARSEASATKQSIGFASEAK